MTARVVIFRRGKKRRTLSISRQSPSLLEDLYGCCYLRSLGSLVLLFLLLLLFHRRQRLSVGLEATSKKRSPDSPFDRPSVRRTAAPTDPLTPFTSPSRPGLIHNHNWVTAERGAPWNDLHAREGFSGPPRIFSVAAVSSG